MSQIEFVMWFEVPFRIYAEPEKGQTQTWNQEGYPAQMTINKIEVAGDELTGLPQPFKGNVAMKDLIEHIGASQADRIEMEGWEYE